MNVTYVVSVIIFDVIAEPFASQRAFHRYRGTPTAERHKTIVERSKQQ